MLLVEKEINRGVFAQIKRYRRFDYDGETVLGFEYAIQIFTPTQNNGIQRVGNFSRYASYETLQQAQKFFVHKYGSILPKHLRGAAKANYLKRLEMSNDSDAVTESVSQPKTTKSQVKTEKVSKPAKAKKVGKLDKIRSIVQECTKQNYNRSECQEYLTLEGFAKSSITRVLNEVFGKVEKSKRSVSTKVVSITPSTTVPSPKPVKVLDLRDRLVQRRAGWDSHAYNVDADLQRFQSRKFVKQFGI